jgi:tetratricopeptide (TPR) repeat protein
MNKKDKQLIEQYISEMKYKSKDDLLARYEERISKMSYTEMNKNPKLVWYRDAGLLPLRILSNSDIYSVMDLGFVEAYQKGEMKSLHEALFTYNRLNFPYIRGISSSEDDGNEYLICRNIIEAFAACDIETVKKYCPLTGPILTKGYKMWFIGYNLILGLLYKNEERIEKGIKQAEKALTTKLPKFDIAVITYLLALAKKDAEQANEQFTAMTAIYKKLGLFNFLYQFVKVYALLPHGLYNMAYYFLSSEDFNKIIPLENTAFWVEFMEYQKSIGFIHGEPYIEFNGNLTSLNSIYK